MQLKLEYKLLFVFQISYGSIYTLLLMLLLGHLNWMMDSKLHIIIYTHITAEPSNFQLEIISSKWTLWFRWYFFYLCVHVDVGRDQSLKTIRFILFFFLIFCSRFTWKLLCWNFTFFGIMALWCTFFFDNQFFLFCAVKHTNTNLHRTANIINN